MQVGDLVRIKNSWHLKGQMGVVTKYVKKKSLPDTVQVYIPNPPPQQPSNWAWLQYYNVEVICK
jgi:hypothetical protein